MQPTSHISYLRAMEEVMIMVVLIVFMALLMGGGVLLVKGILKKQRKQLWIGILLLVLCIAFTFALQQTAWYHGSAINKYGNRNNQEVE